MTAYIKRGFTLIELLIVMAILGVLAVIVLVAINPVEQLARARDTGRISAVQQLGRALEAYYTANATYPGGSTWAAAITKNGDLQVFPAAVASLPLCNGNQVNGYCYNVSGTGDQAVVWALLESQQQTNKCPPGTTNAFSVFSTVDSRGGIGCLATSTGSFTAGNAVVFH